MPRKREKVLLPSPQKPTIWGDNLPIGHREIVVRPRWFLSTRSCWLRGWALPLSLTVPFLSLPRANLALSGVSLVMVKVADS